MLVVHHVFRPDASLQILEVGAVLPMHATALGKAVLAYLPEPERKDVLDAGLPKLTGRTVSTVASLGRELDGVRERGYAVEREEAVLGEVGIAAPIFGRAAPPSAASALPARPSGSRARPRDEGRDVGRRGRAFDLARPRRPALAAVLRPPAKVVSARGASGTAREPSGGALGLMIA